MAVILATPESSYFLLLHTRNLFPLLSSTSPLDFIYLASTTSSSQIFLSFA